MGTASDSFEWYESITNPWRVTYFASGSNHAREIRGFHAQHLGVTAPR